MSSSVVQIGRGPGRFCHRRPSDHCIRRPRRSPEPREPGRGAEAGRAATRTEVRPPDLEGSAEAVGIACDARPDVFDHDVETAPRAYRRVRPGSRFERSLRGLAEAKRRRPDGSERGAAVGA